MAFNEAFTAMNAYAQEQGITFGEALESMKSHPEYPKPNVVARARSAPESTSPASKPAWSPSAGATVRGPPDVHRRRQRVCQGGHSSDYAPPRSPSQGNHRDEGTQSYVTQSGETHQKAERLLPALPSGSPPHWQALG